ncbi:MAG: hypothetical protein CXR30_15910 [Geobacter sp.]|nr:MAG: hypothetical protein CXR30_15910 [Geobacter sp.]
MYDFINSIVEQLTRAFNRLGFVLDNLTMQKMAKDIAALVVIISFLYVVASILIGVNKDYVIVEPFEVPAQLANNGYTSRTIVDKLIADINDIRSNLTISKDAVIVNISSSATPDFVIPGPGNTIRSLIINTKKVLSKPLYVVTGYLVTDNNKLKLMVNLRGEKRLSIANDTEYITSNDNNIDKLIKEAALRLYIQIDPLVAANYYLIHGNINTAINLCDTINTVHVDNCQHIDSNIKYLIWAQSLFSLKKYDLAISKFNQININKCKSDLKFNIYIGWGDTLRKLGKYDNALTKYKSAIDCYNKRPEPYYMIGDILILQGKYRESISYLNTAIDIQRDKYGHGNKTHIQVISNVIDTISRLNNDALDPIKNDLNDLIMSNK